ncbi:hypothetical protein F66182_7634 [Fusarium sp. NRRL 66182]|nr:hypothetical protein F66182_7634 [Fusarium sp. NRRL 66182]
MESHTQNRRLSELACDLELNAGRMIQDIIPAKPSTLRQERPVSSLGMLDTMPAELLLLTLNLLDFQSLSRLARACFRGKIIVESLSAYRQVMRHAPKVLPALAKTGLIGHHPALLVLSTLQTSRCVSCFEFGAFLYLPTCERVLRLDAASAPDRSNHAQYTWDIRCQNARKDSPQNLPACQCEARQAAGPGCPWIPRKVGRVYAQHISQKRTLEQVV